MRRVLFTILFLWVALVRAEGQTVRGFTNKYGPYGTNFITIAPSTAQGIFFQGDTVTISNRLGTAVEVYDFHFNPITNSAPPVVLTNLGLGHYFVQVDGIGNRMGDRTQFSVLPLGYTNHPHSDIGELPAQSPIQSNRYARLAPGFSRQQIWWAQPSSTDNWGIVTVNGTNDWTQFDQFIGNYSNVPNWFGNAPVKVLNIICSHTNMLSAPQASQWHAPPVDQTNSLSSWVHDVALIYSNAAARYGTNAIYEILNEPSHANIDFRAPLNEDPYWSTDGGALPAAMAVSAAVQAVKFVCPTCKAWSPSAQGIDWGAIIDAFAVPYYANVDAISFHDQHSLYGQVDNTVAYTNVPKVGEHILATDTSVKQTAGLYPGKSFVITECYPYSPDALGKTNTWWNPAILGAGAGGGPAPTDAPNWAWGWQTMTMRFWKDLIEYKAAGVTGAQIFLSLWDGHTVGDNSYVGWDMNGVGVSASNQLGCGPLPAVDGQAMISWWLNNATFIVDWRSGSPLCITDPLGGYTSGTPGLHFYEWQFADGSTNTIIWADEETTVTTNFGMGVTDVFSNQWTGPIGIEPVIAWGWPNNSLGGSFSIAPVAAFSAAPTNGAAPLTVTFTDNSAGAITSRSWQFGDGFVTNTPKLTVIHQYTTPGTNSLQLIVSGPSGASTNAQSNIVIVTPPDLSQTNSGGSGGSGGNGGNTGGTNNLLPPGGVANSNWRFLITY